MKHILSFFILLKELSTANIQRRSIMTSVEAVNVIHTQLIASLLSQKISKEKHKL